MKRKLMPIVVVGLLLGTVLTVNSVAWSFEKRPLSRIPADQIRPVKSPVAAGEKDFCELEYTNWITGFYFDDWRAGDKNAIYFDPEECGFQSTYPFQLTDVYLVFWDHASAESVEVRFSVEVVCPDICDGPGIEIWKSQVYNIPTIPDEFTIVQIDFADTVCLDKPFFFNVEYVGDYPEKTMPSLVFDTDTLNIDTCYQWFWREQPNWDEWYDAWTPIPGWALLRISGHCGEEQTECGEWYWKPDTTTAPSGMPDFDQNQDQWVAYCGPTAVANCLWWFDAVPVGWSPPQLIDTLARYFNVGPFGCTPDDIQTGLVQYFQDYGFNHLQEYTFWEPDFYEMEDSLKRCQDIILLLGFWWWNEGLETWYREGGHFVTMAGVNSEKKEIAVSDPDRDQAIQYSPWWPGRFRTPEHPPWDQYPPEFHNDPQFVSHDVYVSLLYPEFHSPDNDKWDLADFCFEGYKYTGKNVPERFKAFTREAPKHFAYYHTEVEAAVMICPKGTAVEGEEGALTPKDFELHQNYPNPFNNETVVKFNLRRSTEVSLAIYNILGQRVRTLVEGRLAAGSQIVSWDGKDDKGNDLSSGIYFYQLKAGEMSETKRLVLLK
ncbi:MAG: T9SS type A sorting domain-containing protein [Candidatus Zixiibacteriota bacterium]